MVIPSVERRHYLRPALRTHGIPQPTSLALTGPIRLLRNGLSWNGGQGWRACQTST